MFQSRRNVMDPEGVTVSVMARRSERERVGERKERRGKEERNYRLTTIPPAIWEKTEDDGMVGREEEERERRGFEASKGWVVATLKKSRVASMFPSWPLAGCQAACPHRLSSHPIHPSRPASPPEGGWTRANCRCTLRCKPTWADAGKHSASRPLRTVLVPRTLSTGDATLAGRPAYPFFAPQGHPGAFPRPPPEGLTKYRPAHKECLSPARASQTSWFLNIWCLVLPVWISRALAL